MEDNKSVVDTAENVSVDETTNQTGTEEKTSEKTYTRAEVNKMMNAERNKVRDEVTKEYEQKKSEAEKLAKMDVEQKLNYELESKNNEVIELKNKLKSIELKQTATELAREKNVPVEYIDTLIDFTKENAESVKEKIDAIVKIRAKDLDGYVKEKLQQPSPKAVDSTVDETDNYIKGFRNYMKLNK